MVMNRRMMAEGEELLLASGSLEQQSHGRSVSRE